MDGPGYEVEMYTHDKINNGPEIGVQSCNSSCTSQRSGASVK